MKNIKKVPKFYWEIISTIILYALLVVLWNFGINEDIVLSDQGLSTIGLALSTSIGVLTAIVVSFVLMIWQSSRQERSTSFWRWRNILRQLVEFFDTKLEVLWEIKEEVANLTLESSGVSLITPMSRGKFKELINKVDDKMASLSKEVQEIEDPSKEEVEKHHAFMYISDYLVTLTTAHFEHNLSHYLYRRVVSLRGLVYRLLMALIISILIVVIGVTDTSILISDTFNAPFAAVLIAWVIYVLILLGREIKRISLLEDEFRKQEGE